MNLGGVGDLALRDGVGDFGVGVGDLGTGVGDLGIGVEAGVEAWLLMDAGVWALGGTGVGVLEGGAGDFGGTGVDAGVAAGVLGCPSLGSGICSPCL